MGRDFTFVHTGDTHLGANWPAIAAKDKVQIPAFGEAFGKVINFSIERHVDFILHSGDLIDHPRPSVAAFSRLLDELTKLRAENVPFLTTKGSHDASSSFFDRMGGNWLYMLDKKLGLLRYVDVELNAYTDVKAADGSNVRVYGLGDYGNRQEEMLNQLVPKMRRDGSDYGILLMHGSILEMPHARGGVVPLSNMTSLIGRGLIDYVALGHNHQRWEDDRINATNPGSTEFTSFAEASKSRYAWMNGELQAISVEESPKGFYIVNVEGEITSAKFQLLQTRDVRDIIVDFAEATPEDIVEGLVTALQGNSHPKAILRPIATGSLSRQYRATDIKIAEIMQGASDALYVSHPVLSFQGRAAPLVRPAAEMSYQAILEQAFSTRYGAAAQEVARLADSIVESYWTLGQRAHANALEYVESFDMSRLKAEALQDAEKA